MNTKDLLSIIIPVYNSERFIKETLTSLERQTCRNFNVVIVNDGSTDSSESIIFDYIAKSTLKIEYFYQDNQGVSVARNKGIQKSSSRYLMFCDSDDLYHEKMVETMLLNFERYEVDIVGCGVSHSLFADRNQRESIICTLSDLQNDFLFNNRDYQFCLFCYKKEIIDKYNILFSSDLLFGEDDEFTWRYLCHAKSVYRTSLALYYYRDNPSSVTKKITAKRMQVIDSMIRVSNYYAFYEDNYSYKLKKYGVSRAKLAIAREFAFYDKKDLYRELIDSSNYKCSLFPLLAFPSLKIKLAGFIFIISKSIFFKLFRSRLF